MDSASNPEELQSAWEEKTHKGDVPSKDLPYSNRSFQELSQTDDKVVSPTDGKSSSSGSSEAVPEPCTIGQPDLAKPTQDDPLNTTFPEKTLHITDNLSKETSGEKGSVSTGKPIIKSVECSYCKPFPEETGSTSINRFTLSQETGSIGEIPVPLEISTSRNARKAPNSTSDTKLELTVLDDIINVSNTNEVLTVESSASPTDVKSSSSGSSEAVPEPCTIGQPDLAKPTQDDPLNTTFPEKTLHITDNLSKETSGEKGSVSTGKPIIKSVECSYCKPAPEETGSTSINRFTLSQETRSIGEIPVPLEISKSRNARKAPNSTSDTKLELTVLDDIINVSNTNEVLTVESSASPIDLKILEIDASLSATENIKTPEFQHDGEKNMQEGNLGSFVFVSTKTLCVGHSTALPSTLSKHTVPTFDFPLVSSSLTSSTKESKPLYQDLKPSVHLDKNYNKSLNDMFSILENWARRGMDNTFNRPVKFSSVNIGANFEKDLKFGLGVMKEMTTRIYTLMRAANKLPDPGTILLHGFERIHGDLINTGITMWNTIDDIELHVSNDCKKLKLICDNVSEKSIEDMEEGPNPNILITNAYTLVTERLLLLRIQMESFREKIRVFCSEIDNLL